MALLHAAHIVPTVEDEMIKTPQERRSSRVAPTLWTRQFVAVALATLAYFIGDGILIAAVPRFVTGPLGGGAVAVGVVVGAFSVSAFFLRPWVGGLGDRRGRRPLMVTGAGLFSVSVLGYAAASDPATLFVLRLVTGAGEAFFFVGAVAAFTDLAPAERRGEAMSLASLLPGLVLLASILGMAAFLTFVPLYALDLGMSGSRLVLLVFAAVVVGIRTVGAGSPTCSVPPRRSVWP
ncbi:MAG: MFS transporter [Egibacteraceae bacterium]